MWPLLLLLWGGSLQEEPGYKLQVTEVVTVQAGLCVLVPCSFSCPWSWSHPPAQLYISWLQDHFYYTDLVATSHPRRAVETETKNRFLLLEDVRAGNCSLSIRDARLEDTGSYILQVEIGQNVIYIYRDKKLRLLVTALTEKPTIHFPGPLVSGCPTRLSCSLPGSCEGGRPLSFSWTGDVLNSMEGRTLYSPVLTFTPWPQDHGTNLTCEVKLRGTKVTKERTVQLNVSYAPQNLSIFSRNGTALKILKNASSLPILEGQALQLLCAVDSNPPAQLSWLWGSPTPNASHVSNAGILQLPPVGSAEEGIFTCQAQNAVGSQSASVSLSVLSPLKLLGPSCSWEAEGLHCSCSSRAWPAPSLRWRLGEQLLDGNSSMASPVVTSRSAGPWANSSLSFRGALSSGLRLSCEAQNAHGEQNMAVLLLPGKPVSRAEVALAALGGAGSVALLSLCLCLIFFCIAKAHRKQAPSRPVGMDDKEPVMGTVTWGSRQTSWTVSPQDQAPPWERQELHYASLSFLGMKSQEPQNQDTPSSTEYSEIKRNK